MRGPKCERPGCKKKGTVKLAINGQKMTVCQQDVNWAYRRMTAAEGAHDANEERTSVETSRRGEEGVV